MKMGNLFKSLRLLCLFLWSLITFCYGDLPELSSDDPIEFDENTQEIIARGNAELFADQAFIRADEIRFDRESLDGVASGNVVINTDGMRLVGKAIHYNISGETLASEAFRAGQPPIFISSKGASGTLNDLEIGPSTVFFGEPDFLSPNFLASKIEVIDAQDEDRPTRVIGRNIIFRIGKVPFFYLPYFSHTMREIPVDITTDYGVSKEYGCYFRHSVLFETTPYLKTGALIDYYTDRGFLIGPAAEYYKIVDNKVIRGELQSGFIHDTGDKKQLGVDSIGNPIPRNRNFVEWHHQQNLTENLQITGLLRRWRDSEVLRDFRPKLFNHNIDPDNFTELVYTGRNYYITAFTRFSPNNFQDVRQRIPELNFNLLPTRIGCTPIFNTINAKVAHLEKENPKTYKKVKSDRLDIFYGLHAPFNVTNFLTFTPLVGGQIDEYFERSTSSGNFTRYRGQVGFDMQTNAYGQWNCKNGIWKIDGLRHIVRPTINYRFIPQGHTGRGLVPQIDTHIFTTNIHPIDLSYLRDIDDARVLHKVRFGLENVLQTRDNCYGSRELAYLNMYQDYLIKESVTGNRWSDLYTELGLSPAYWMDFKLYNRINVNNFTFNELRTCLELKDARFWSLKYIVDTLLHPKRHQHFLDFRWHVTPRTSIRNKCRYDFRLHQITEEIYAISNRISNVWGAELQIIHRRHAVRESKWELSLLFSVLPLNTDLLPIPL